MRMPGARLRPALFLLWLGLGAFPREAPAARSSQSIRPDQFREALSLTVEGNERTYWSLDRERPLGFDVRGPGQVKLITRLALSDSASKGSYEIIVRQGENEIARRDFRVLPATDVRGGDAAAWGRHRNITFRVPPGSHRYRVLLTGEGGGSVAVRPRFLPPRPPRRRVSITPETYERVLTLVRDEKEITYYRLTPGSPLKVTIVGPTELQVNTRLEFDQTMKGDTHCYAVEVCEKGVTLGQATYEVTRSQVAVYRNRSTVVPGVAKSFRVALDEGPHELKIWFKNTVARGVAVKLYLPAEDVIRKATRKAPTGT
jgi:hypothetical protein